MSNPERKEIPDEVLMDEFVKTLKSDTFDILMMRHYPGACAFARNRLIDKDAAYDAVQEAFITVVRNRERYDASRSFSSWFYAILRNICIDMHRARARYNHKINNWSMSVQSHNETRNGGYAGGLLETLPDLDREMLTLKLVNGLSFPEIADSYGCSVDAVKKRCQRALKRLKNSN